MWIFGSRHSNQDFLQFHDEVHRKLNLWLYTGFTVMHRLQQSHTVNDVVNVFQCPWTPSCSWCGSSILSNIQYHLKNPNRPELDESCLIPNMANLGLTGGVWYWYLVHACYCTVTYLLVFCIDLSLAALQYMQTASSSVRLDASTFIKL